MEGFILKKSQMSKVIAASLATSVLVPFAVAEANTDFKDVSKDSYFYKYVQELTDRGVVSGFEDGTFKPLQQATRAQAAKILYGLVGNDEVPTVDPGFTDVSKSAYYYDAVAFLTQAGVISSEAEKFNPNESITRAEFSIMLVKAFDLRQQGDVKLPFNDIEAGSKVEEYVKVLFESEVIHGTSNITFSPAAQLSRAQLSKMIVLAEKKQEKYDLTVMHTNDTHARVEMAPQRLTAVNEVRTLKPNSLLLDGGDVFTGTLYFNEFTGEPDVEFMNMMGYNAMTFGNHEFDLGSSPEGHKALAEFVKSAKFSMLAGNIDFSGDPLFKDLIEGKDAKIKPYIIEEVNGEKYGIFGLTTPDTAGISSPGEVKFAEDYIAEAKKIVAELEAQGINRIIAVTHIGNEAIEGTANDQALAAGVPEIDIIVGGHSHSKVEPPQKVDNGKHGPTIIVQANEYSKYLGTLDVSFDGNGVITKHRGELIEVAKKAPNAKALEVLKPYKEQVEKKMNEKIGVTLKTTLTNPRGTPISVRSHETALGNIITDGMLAKAKQLEGENAEHPTIFAMQNGGGIRVPIEAGEVTTGQIIAVLPFGNTLAHVSLTGKEIKEVFEHSFAKFPEEEGGFLHIAGGKVEVDTSQPSGERVISVSYEGKDGEWVALDLTNDEELFKIATNAFTAKGGDAYTTLGKAYEEGRGGDYGDSEADWENLRNRLVYLQENNIEITDQPAGRIIDKNQK